MPTRSSGKPIAALPAYDRASGDLNVVIETPKGSHAKFDYDEELGLFELGGMLPQGSSFPFSFGFIPSTLAPDGDPVDVLLLMEEPAFTGCLVRCRLVGVLEAEQTEEDGETTRNDRLIAVASHSREHSDVLSVKHLPKALTGEIEHFFVSYNEVRGKRFKPLGYHGPRRAAKLVESGTRRRRRARKG
jgi:inorganic pyrophosphatase